MIPSVNLHITRHCNLKCRFCFAHFYGQQDAKWKQWLPVLEELRQVGIQKVNFVGGEPLVFRGLAHLLRRAKELGFLTSLTTNGTLLTREWLEKQGKYLDWIAISCDSANPATLAQLGRGCDHAQITQRVFREIQNYNHSHEHQIRTKLNSTITALQREEDMSSFVLTCSPNTWKIFQMLWIKGENDDALDLTISKEDFQNFVKRHEHLKTHGMELIVESDEDMMESYLMLNPEGQFFQNGGHTYTTTRSVFEVGVQAALEEIYVSVAKFRKRRGDRYF